MDKPAGKDVRVLNPLWIISLFLAIAEITIGAVATQVHSWVQGLFAIFATAFPTGVAAVFFTILWKKPYVLYAPRDFPRHLDALDYVKAMLWARSAKEEGTESAVVA